MKEQEEKKPVVNIHLTSIDEFYSKNEFKDDIFFLIKNDFKRFNITKEIITYCANSKELKNRYQLYLICTDQEWRILKDRKIKLEHH